MDIKVLENETEIRDLLIKKIYGYCLTQAIRTAALFKIPDLLKISPLNISQLSEAMKCPEDSLSRLMSFLISEDIFTIDNSSYYHNNKFSFYLTQDHPQTLYNLATMHGSKLWWEMWSELPSCITFNTSAPMLNYHTNIFEHFDQPCNHPDRALFDKAMRNIASADVGDFLEKYDMTRFSSVIDVGGGSGMMISAIKYRYPNLDCYLFEKNNAHVDHDSAMQGIKYICGDFFKEIPCGKDLYIMRHIIHNWDDDSALQILKNCRRAMKGSSKLCILEFLEDYSSKTNIIRYRDMNMLVAMPLGKERTKLAMTQLLKDSGFICETVIALTSDINVIECSVA